MIDLQQGRAVRAAGGIRDHYQPTRHFQAPEQPPITVEGSSETLVACYQDLGIRALYLADLDGIRFDHWQCSLITSIANQVDGQLLLDLGIHASPKGQRMRWLQNLMRTHPKLALVLATECAASLTVLSDLLETFGHDRVAVSFDYKNESWQSEAECESNWITACHQHRIATLIGLDIGTVGGKSTARTKRLCQRLRRQLPEPRYITGGGIRTPAAAQDLINAGADALLVASLFTA